VPCVLLAREQLVGLRPAVPEGAQRRGQRSGLLVTVVFWLRSHYQAPLTGTGLISPAGGTGQAFRGC